VIEDVRRTHPALPIILYISGSGGLLERMAAANPDIISIDQSVDITDGIKRVGSGFAIQVRARACRARPLALGKGARSPRKRRGWRPAGAAGRRARNGSAGARACRGPCEAPPRGPRRSRPAPPKPAP
jgi:hypothetical protein